MKKIDFFYRASWCRAALLVVMGSLLGLGARAQAALTWAGLERYPNAGSGAEVRVAPDGSQYVTGSFSNTLTLGTITLTAGSGNNTFLAKYSPTGAVLWARQLSTPGTGVPALAVDATGNAYLAGTFSVSLTIGSTVLTAANGSAYLLKFDGQGTSQVLQQGGGAELTITDLAIGASGNLGLLGVSTAAATFGGVTLAGPGTCYFKCSPTGTVLLGTKLSTETGATALALDGADNIYLTGSYRVASVTFGALALSQANGAPVYFPMVYLYKLDATGTGLWAKNVEGNSQGAGATSLTVDAAGNPIVSVISNNQYNINTRAIRFNTQGTQLWAWGASGPAGMYNGNGISSAAYDGNGGCYITGYGASRIPSPFVSSTGYQLFVVHLNSLGNDLAAVQAVGTGAVYGTGYAIFPDSRGNSVAVGANGTAYVVGTASNGTVTFGPASPVVIAHDIIYLKFTASNALATKQPIGAASLRAYPNPASGQLVLDLPVGGQRLVISDALGRTVRQQALPAVAGPWAVSLAGLAPGFYQLCATLANGQMARTKLEVQ